VAVLPDRGHDAAVALGSTRLRVLQVYALIAWHTDLSVVALGSTRLRVLQERLLQCALLWRNVALGSTRLRVLQELLLLLSGE